jgi:hypothetical protein
MQGTPLLFGLCRICFAYAVRARGNLFKKNKNTI